MAQTSNRRREHSQANRTNLPDTAIRYHPEHGTSSLIPYTNGPYLETPRTGNLPTFRSNYHNSPVSNGGHLGIGHQTQEFYSLPSDKQLQAEVSRLRQQLEDLKGKYANLEAKYESSNRILNSCGSTVPSTATFSDSWKKRTEARLQIFCSPNRAGNALCVWHDSRRERRAFPPRCAPPGFLNCGCTYEEALFEESLARRGVGSYLPGQFVRMDPDLRNPLLKLLQDRYGYRDGDFERDPITGEWVDGEGGDIWQQKANAVSTSRRRATNTT